MDKAVVERFLELRDERDGHDKQIKAINEELTQLEQTLLSQFEELGATSLRVGNRTVYVHRQLWANAKDGDYDRACAALRDADLAEFVQERFNTNQISAYVREVDDKGEDLPPELEEALSVYEKFSVRAVRS